jgi:uncharacterized protein (DUF4213/DUF364 family)
MKMACRENILEETLTRLKVLYQEEKLVPGTITWIAIKPQWNVIIGTNGQCGMAINFTGIHDIYRNPEVSAKSLKPLIGKNLWDVANEKIISTDMWEKAIGIAAMNALSQPFLSPGSLRKRGFEVVEGMPHVADFVTHRDIVSIIGYGGVVREVVGKCRELHITEMRSQDTFQTIIIGEEIEFGPKALTIHPESENKAVLGKSDVVIITGSAIVNGTFDELMSYSTKARTVGMYGPSVSFIPDILFEQGVDFIFSYWVNDPARFEYDMFNEIDMEVTLKAFQKQHVMWREK